MNSCGRNKTNRYSLSDSPRTTWDVLDIEHKFDIRYIECTVMVLSASQTEYQVSAGIRKRLSDMTRAERSRVLNAMLAESYLRSEVFQQREQIDPEWAIQVRNLAARINSTEGPSEDEEVGFLIQIPE